MFIMCENFSWFRKKFFAVNFVFVFLDHGEVSPFFIRNIFEAILQSVKFLVHGLHLSLMTVGNTRLKATILGVKLRVGK